MQIQWNHRERLGGNVINQFEEKNICKEIYTYCNMNGFIGVEINDKFYLSIELQSFYKDYVLVFLSFSNARRKK